MGLGSGRSLCRGEGVSGAPAAVGGRGLHPDSSLSPTLISDSTCGGELIGSPIHHNDDTFLWYRIVVIMCCMIAGQRPASAASSGLLQQPEGRASARRSAQQPHQQKYKTGGLCICGFVFLIRLNHWW